jgi:hypothetical protein
VLLFHRIQNISLGGVCIQTDRGRGGRHAGRPGAELPGAGRVDSGDRARSCGRTARPPMDMGIRYVDLDEERKDTLRKYINMVRK